MQPAELEGTRMRVVNIGLQDRGIEWKPDIEMPIPFSERDIHIMQALWNGEKNKNIHIDLGYSSAKVKHALTRAEPYSISAKIQVATDCMLSPRGSSQQAIWMYKHKFLRRETIDSESCLPRDVRFGHIQLWLAKEFLSGIVMEEDLRRSIAESGCTRPVAVRNYFNGDPDSISAIITSIDGKKPVHRLDACVWLVKHGIIAENVIGERLP